MRSQKQHKTERNVTFNPKGSSLLRLKKPQNSFYIVVGAVKRRVVVVWVNLVGV